MTKQELALAKHIADKQFEELCRTGDSTGMISFLFNDDVEIINPWVDPTGRFFLTDEEAFATYGKANVEAFVKKCAEEQGCKR